MQGPGEAVKRVLPGQMALALNLLEVNYQWKLCLVVREDAQGFWIFVDGRLEQRWVHQVIAASNCSLAIFR